MLCRIFVIGVEKSTKDSVIGSSSRSMALQRIESSTSE